VIEKMAEFKCPRCGAVLVLSVTVKEHSAAETETKTVTLSSVKVAFPEDLEPLLTYEDKGDKIILKPKQLLSTETFAEIAAIVRDLGGEYVSAGKDSYFKISK
jgi:transcription elongation factor Elf1